jgi:CRP-like cAMP-binding protein
MPDWQRDYCMKKSEIDNGKTVYQSGEVEAPVQIFLDEPPRVTPNYKFPKPIPFTGLLTNKILTSLPGEDFARLLPHLEPVSLSTGQDVYKFGERVDFIYFPETLVVSYMYFLQDGSATAAAIVGKEGIVGLSVILDSRPPSHWAQVTVGGTAVRVRPEFIKEEFTRGNAMQRILLKYVNSRLAQLSQKAVCNGRHKLEERFCTWLLMVHDRSTEPALPLTHEEIARHLGSRRAGITAITNTLRDSGTITYRRGMICIVDRARLEAAACECYEALREFQAQQD